MAQQKIALVTGANKGIGFEICRQLAQKDCIVLLGARNEVEGKEAASLLFREGNVQYQYIDMEKPEAFTAVRNYIEREFGKLDILVNNAGIALDGNYKVDTIPLETIRSTFETNFFSLITLTQTLLPLLHKSREGARIVNQSSILGSLTLHSDPDEPLNGFRHFAYNASKTALNAFTVHLANALKDTAIKVNSAHPGSVKTNMNPEGILNLVEGAATAVELALLPPDGPSGRFFHLGQELPW